MSGQKCYGSGGFSRNVPVKVSTPNWELILGAHERGQQWI